MSNLVSKISNDLCLSENYINNIINRANFFYKDYEINKHDGTKRRISQAGPELKTLQYWVASNILNKLPISAYAFAYKKGFSIKDHAKYHAGAKHILHIDIKNFFPSISSGHLFQILKEHKNLFTNFDIMQSLDYIGKICFRLNKLCIGTVSSPMLSNVIMYKFDEKMARFCRDKNMKYSRYSDDFYISSYNYIPIEILDYIKSELFKIGFEINRYKTKFFSKKYRQRVTGLILAENKKISVGKARKIEIKKMIYNKLKKNKGNPNEILGYLSFLKDVEPNTYDNLIIKYSKYTDIDIIEALKKQ